MKGKKGRDIMAIKGYNLYQKTELGKALAKVLPPKIQRIIIDIPADDIVKIYYQSVDTDSILDLKWDEIIEQFEIIRPAKKSKKSKKDEKGLNGSNP